MYLATYNYFSITKQVRQFSDKYINNIIGTIGTNMHARAHEDQGNMEIMERNVLD